MIGAAKSEDEKTIHVHVKSGEMKEQTKDAGRAEGEMKSNVARE